MVLFIVHSISPFNMQLEVWVASSFWKLEAKLQSCFDTKCFGTLLSNFNANYTGLIAVSKKSAETLYMFNKSTKEALEFALKLLSALVC